MLIDYILEGENYDIDNMKAARYIFFLMKQIKKNLSALPKNMDEVRSTCITYGNDTKKLEKEKHHLHKIIDMFYETIDKFIKWICHKFEIGESKELIKNFQEETHTFIDPIKQINKDFSKDIQNLEL